MPQIIGALEPELVTENVSVKHCEARRAGVPAKEFGDPLIIFVCEFVSVVVLGPVIAKVLKSSLSCEKKSIDIFFLDTFPHFSRTYYNTNLTNI